MTTKDILTGGIALLALALPAFAANGKNKPDVDVSYEELAVIYSNKDNSVVQRFSLYGELAIQWAEGVSNQGAFGSRNLGPTSATSTIPGTPSTLWDGLDARRWRVGARAEVFRDFKFTGIIDINPNFDPFYRDIYELYLTYAPNDAFNLSAGKRKAHFFSQEYNTSSREMIVFELSLLTAMLIPKELSGIWVDGKIGDWNYTFAAYPGDYREEFSRFDAGLVTQTSLGYDFARRLDADKALVRLDWQASTSGRNSYGPGNFSHAFSLSTAFQQGRFYGYTDFLGGLGRGSQGDVWGVVLTPTYFIIPDRLQFVLRYQYAHGDSNGLRLQRYETLAPDLTTTSRSGRTTKSSTGSEYQAVYLGLNSVPSPAQPQADDRRRTQRPERRREDLLRLDLSRGTAARVLIRCGVRHFFAGLVLLLELGENCADLLHGADGEDGFVFEDEAGLQREGLQRGDVRAVADARVAHAVGGRELRVRKPDAKPLAPGIHPRGPRLAEMHDGILRARRAGLPARGRRAGPRGGSFFTENERFAARRDEDRGQLLVRRLVHRGAGEGHAIFQSREAAFECEPLLQKHVVHVRAARPLAGLRLHVERVLGFLFLQHNRGDAFPASALHGVVAPRFAVPLRAVRVAVIRLLHVAAMVECIEQIPRRVRMREPADAPACVHVHAEADLAVVEVDPVFLRAEQGCVRDEAEEENKSVDHRISDSEFAR